METVENHGLRPSKVMYGSNRSIPIHFTMLRMDNPSVAPELNIECPVGFQAFAHFSQPLTSGQSTCEFFEQEQDVEVILCY